MHVDFDLIIGARRGLPASSSPGDPITLYPATAVIHSSGKKVAGEICSGRLPFRTEESHSS